MKKIKLVILVLAVTFSTVSCRSCSEAADVAHEEFGPRAALEKYEQFKNQAAALDKKRADVLILETNLEGMVKDYNGEKKRSWEKSDRQQYRQWQSELAGLKMSYNRLASEYNANMAKFNFRFANRGDLPAGATEPLPREFKQYITK